MKKEQIESVIKGLIHQNLTVVNKGTDEHPGLCCRWNCGFTKRVDGSI